MRSLPRGRVGAKDDESLWQLSDVTSKAIFSLISLTTSPTLSLSLSSLAPRWLALCGDDTNKMSAHARLQCCWIKTLEDIKDMTFIDPKLSLRSSHVLEIAFLFPSITMVVVSLTL